MADSTFSVSPSSAAVGGTVKVSSVTPCPPPSGGGSINGNVALYQGGNPVGDPVGLSIDAGGNWSANLQVPYAASPGPAQIVAQCFDNNGGNVLYQPANFTVLRTVVAAYTGPSSTDFNDAVRVSGSLKDASTGAGVQGRTLTFTLNGSGSPSSSCSAMTDSSGDASCSLTPGQPAGSYSLVVSSAPDGTFASGSATASFAVAREQTTLSYDGPFQIANGSPATLTATLAEDGTAAPNPAGQTVTLALGAGGSAQTCTGTVDSTGHVQCTIANVQQPNSGTFTVPFSDSFAGDAYYLPSGGSGAAKLLYYGGGAYGASASLLGSAPTLYAETGHVTTAQPYQTQHSMLSATFGALGLGGAGSGLTAGVTTGSGASLGQASVASFTVGGLLAPIVRAQNVSASSRSTCQGTTGSATIGSLTVNGVSYPVGNPAANTKLDVAGLTIILNEQQVVSGADHGLTVNAIHISYPGGLDDIFGSAASDIHNCS